MVGLSRRRLAVLSMKRSRCGGAFALVAYLVCASRRAVSRRSVLIGWEENIVSSTLGWRSWPSTSSWCRPTMPCAG